MTRIKTRSVAPLLLCVLACLMAPCTTAAQGQNVPVVQQRVIAVQDASALKPPAGAHVAIVEFADFECPACGYENPLLMSAVAHYKIPWMRHDFPLRQHPWSFQAAVNARWFDTQSKKIGDEYRNALFGNQRNIETLDDLRRATDQFARDRGLAMPFALDPQGKFAEMVKADQALGTRIGIQETPTLWIVTSGGGAPPYTQVVDSAQLYTMIDQALSATGGTSKPVSTSKPAAKTKAANTH